MPEPKISASQKNHQAKEFQSRLFFLPLTAYAIRKGKSSIPIVRTNVPPMSLGLSCVQPTRLKSNVTNTIKKRDHGLIFPLYLDAKLAI